MSQLGRTAGLTGFLEMSRKVGVDAHQLAAVVGLPPASLTDPDLRVSVESMARMFEMAAEQSGVEDFALRVAGTRRLSNLGVVGLVIREQPNVRGALQAYARYQWFQNDAYSLDVREDGERATIRVLYPPWQQRQIAELSLATVVRNLKSILGEAWRPLEVRFTHAAPARLDSHRRVFGVTPLFDQDGMAVVISKADMDTRIPSADPAMARQVAAYLERLTQGRSNQLSDKVGDLIVALLPDGDCTVEQVARRLGMDRRTLHRRLAAEGLTFSGILDETRRDMAVSLLASSDRPLQGVADLLGFSSLSAFAHWFRRKFAQSASAYRAAQGATSPSRPANALAPAE